MPDRLMLLDAPSLYFRAFHGVPQSVTGPDGTPVNAVRGFLDIVARQVRAHPPQRLVACFDLDWRPAFRVEALPSYKLHRVAPDGGDGTPDTLAPQVPVIEEVLDAMGVARAGAEGFEADDVIGTLAERHGGAVDVVTGDRDLFQLVRDDRPVRVIYSVEKFRPVDEAEVTARYAIPGRGYGEFAVLRGDPSDGLPGVAGIGAKSAAALVSRFGSVDAVLAALDAGETAGFPTGTRTRLAAARDYLALAPRVVRVECGIDRRLLPDTGDLLPAAPGDPEALVALVDRWGLDRPVGRLLGAMAEVTASS